MMPTFLSLALALLAPGDAPEAPRKANPFAPSLPLLTDEEEARLDQIIDDFIRFDTGQLKGEAGKKALREFQKLGPEAIFALIRGMNKAAGIEASCPAVTIGKKLIVLLRGSRDPQLLEFARENIGAGVGRSPHMAVIKDLRVVCLLRKRDLNRGGVQVYKGPVAAPPSGTPPESPYRGLSLGELVKAAAAERGEKLQAVLGELERRDGDEVLAALAAAAGHYEANIQKLARDLLARHLSRQSLETLKIRLKDERNAVRVAAVRVLAEKRLRLGNELIDLLTDSDGEVRQTAHKALVQMARGTDFGPSTGALEADRADAMRQWRAWWAKQPNR